MAAMHPNAQLIRDYIASVEQFIQALENGTAKPGEYENKYIAGDVIAHYPGRSDIAGWHRGDSFFKIVAPRLQQYKSSIVELIDVLASDERAAIIVRERLEAADGRALEFVRVAVYRIVDGKIAEMWVRDDDQYAMDAFLMNTKSPESRPA